MPSSVNKTLCLCHLSTSSETLHIRNTGSKPNHIEGRQSVRLVVRQSQSDYKGLKTGSAYPPTHQIESNMKKIGGHWLAELVFHELLPQSKIEERNKRRKRKKERKRKKVVVVSQSRDNYYKHVFFVKNYWRTIKKSKAVTFLKERHEEPK